MDFFNSSSVAAFQNIVEDELVDRVVFND